MNQFTLLVIALVIFTYYGGSNVPKVLKDNRELLLGVVVGLVLCSFLGMRLEGVKIEGEDDMPASQRHRRQRAPTANLSGAERRPPSSAAKSGESGAETSATGAVAAQTAGPPPQKGSGSTTEQTYRPYQESVGRTTRERPYVPAQGVQPRPPPPQREQP